MCADPEACRSREERHRFEADLAIWRQRALTAEAWLAGSGHPAGDERRNWYVEARVGSETYGGEQIHFLREWRDENGNRCCENRPVEDEIEDMLARLAATERQRDAAGGVVSDLLGELREAQEEVERLRGALAEGLVLVLEIQYRGATPWGSGTHRVVAWQDRARAALTPADALERLSPPPAVEELDESYPPDAQPTGDAARKHLRPGEEKLIEEYEQDVAREKPAPSPDKETP